MKKPIAILLTIAALVVTGCASKGYVREEVEASEARTAEQIEAVESQVEANQTRIAEQQEQLDSLSQTSREALERAIAAGVLAEGEGFRVAEAAVWALGNDGARLPISPCGGCRQRLSELAVGPDVLLHFCWPGRTVRSMRIEDLLPCAFALAPP